LSSSRRIPDLTTLVELFYPSLADLGEFEKTTAAQLAEPYRRLLAHDEHMTVTVEAFHNCPVDVRVLATRLAPPHYARKILLTRQSDGVVVQFGIVRLNFDCLAPDVQREIEEQGKPLGRILIEHNVLRQVELVELWKLTPGKELQALFGLATHEPCFGRTALIHCDGEPAVELLEVVTPVA
jgi:chorismate-pyruvate lyase